MSYMTLKRGAALCPDIFVEGSENQASSVCKSVCEESHQLCTKGHWLTFPSVGCGRDPYYLELPVLLRTCHQILPPTTTFLLLILSPCANISATHSTQGLSSRVFSAAVRHEQWNCVSSSSPFAFHAGVRKEQFWKFLQAAVVPPLRPLALWCWEVETGNFLTGVIQTVLIVLFISHRQETWLLAPCLWREGWKGHCWGHVTFQQWWGSLQGSCDEAPVSDTDPSGPI